MNLKLEFEFSRVDLFKYIDTLKRQVDAMRPMPEDVEGRVMQKLRLDWNYHSNAIEGNRLNYGETVAFLMEGITAKGKPLKDHLDIRGHNEAINFLLEIVKDTRPLSEMDIRALHKMILVEPYDSPAKTADGLPTTKRITLGEYKTSPNHVKTATGEIHYYATPEETPAKMQELMEWYDEVMRYGDIHVAVIAALFHHKFVAIHPFDDGNGRLSRILMNLILMQNGYPPVVVKMDDRTNYYSLLSRADVNDSWPFVEYITELLQSSLQLFINAANGGDIDEDSDIDKEITLFKLEVQNRISTSKKADKEVIDSIIEKSIIQLIDDVIKKVSQFDELFDAIRKNVIVSYTNPKNNNKTTHNIPVDIPKALTTFLRIGSIINSIEVAINFERFKTAGDKFSIKTALSIVFEDGSYFIKPDGASKPVVKNYPENLSKEEIKTIIKDVVLSIKKSINSNVQ